MTGAVASSAAVPVQHRGVLAVAWGGTLLLSRLPEIALQEGFGLEATWMPVAWVLTAALLLPALVQFRNLRPLGGYFAVLGGVIALTSVVDPLVRQSGLWQGIISADGDTMRALLAERILLALWAVAVLGGLLALGRGRPSYLAVGDFRASFGVRLPWMSRPPSWGRAGPFVALSLAILTAGAAAGLLPDAIAFELVLPLLAVAAIAAALNAFAEEVLYRAAPLSQLSAVIGSGQAVLLLAVWFGLGHFYGGLPSGPAGAIQAGAVALLFGKAMVDTRGLAWPWILHFSVDMVIYAALALSIVGTSA